MDTNSTQTVAIFDLDSTITSRDTHLPFYLFYLQKHPQKWLKALPVLFASVRYVMAGRERKRLKEAFLRTFLGGVAHEEASAFAKTYAAYWVAHHLRKGAITQIKEHRDRNHPLIMATASFHLYADHIADMLGFDHVIATPIVRDDTGRITGELDGPNCRGEVKRDAVTEYLSQNYPSAHRIFYSDDVADLALLSVVEEPIFVNPNPKSRKVANAKGWPIVDWRNTTPVQEPGSV